MARPQWTIGWIRHGKATPFSRNTAVGSLYIAARLNDRYPESWLADPQHILIAFAPSSPKKTNLITLVFTVVGPLHAPTYQWDSTYLRYPNHIQSLGFSYGFPMVFTVFTLEKWYAPRPRWAAASPPAAPQLIHVASAPRLVQGPGRNCSGGWIFHAFSWILGCSVHDFYGLFDGF